MTPLIIIITLAAIAITSLMIYAYAISKEKSKPSQGRRGVIYCDYSYYDGDWSYGQTYTHRKVKCRIFVEEIDTCADQSKVKILEIDGLKYRGLEIDLSKLVGNWYATADIKWDTPRIVPDKEDKTTEIIKTPLSELVKHIENDEIEGI